MQFMTGVRGTPVCMPVHRERKLMISIEKSESYADHPGFPRGTCWYSIRGQDRVERMVREELHPETGTGPAVHPP